MSMSMITTMAIIVVNSHQQFSTPHEHGNLRGMAG
jgi:hypothetical protein